MSFKTGDKVKCIDDVQGTSLNLNIVYTVEKSGGGFVYLREVSGGWLADRFIKYDDFVLDAIDA